MPRTRSASRYTHAANRMLKINKLRMALRNQAQTVTGRRGRVMPVARRSMVVTLKFRALARAAAQKSATLTIQRVMPACGTRKKAVVISKKRGYGEPKREQVKRGEGHVSRADLDGQEVVAEPGLWRSGQNHEHHQRAVEQRERRVPLRRALQASEERQCAQPARPGEYA